jgi:DNA-binding Lrp family transcriptional regulator
MTAPDLALADAWQRGFPLARRPFAAIAAMSALSEGEAIEHFQSVAERGALSRIGAVVRPHAVGWSTLAAMAVPPERLEEVAALVNAEPGVNHNYERTHRHNLWFVVTGADPATVAATLARLESRTGLATLDLPLVEAFHLDLGFRLADRAASPRGTRPPSARPVSALDRRLLAALEDGLTITARPYDAIAAQLGLSLDQLFERLSWLIAEGVISRFGAVLRHRAIGFSANAMAVWALPEPFIRDAAAVFVRDPRVTLCYRRPARGEPWPYTLFCMIHARSREDALAAIADLNRAADTAWAQQDVLFSTRCFKQRGARYGASERIAA